MLNVHFVMNGKTCVYAAGMFAGETDKPYSSSYAVIHDPVVAWELTLAPLAEVCCALILVSGMILQSGQELVYSTR